MLLLPLPALVTTSRIGSAILAGGQVFCLLRAADLAFNRRVDGFLTRLVMLCAVLDITAMTRCPRALAWDKLIRFGLSTAVMAVVVAVFVLANGCPELIRHVLHWLAVGVGLFAGFEMFAALVNVASGFLGRCAPPTINSPYRATSLADFWANRWNLAVANLLRDLVFKPLARQGVEVALFASFALSAEIHAYVIFMMLGGLDALSWAAFFMVQPILILAERRIGVRRWKPVAGRLWTFTLLALFSPLFIDPVLKVIRIIGDLSLRVNAVN